MQVKNLKRYSSGNKTSIWAGIFIQLSIKKLFQAHLCYCSFSIFRPGMFEILLEGLKK